MSGSPFLAFAERHDLDYAERVAPGARGRSQLPDGEVSEIAGGPLPGGLEGLVGRLVQREKRGGSDIEYVRNFGLLMTRVPEALSFIPYLSCRDTEFHGVADRLVGPGGLIPLVDHIEFESIELNRRYRIGIFRGTSENDLRQLFAPTFVDWMASAAPDGLFFELFGGMLLVTLEGEVSEEEDVERLCALSSRIVERIRSEAVEGAGLGGSMAMGLSPAQVEAERKVEERLARAGFDDPPTEVASAQKRLEPVVRQSSGGILRRVFRSINRDEATALALEAVLRAYASGNGMERERPQEFVARHMGMRLPIFPTFAMRGELPGTGARGDLVAVGLGRSDDGPMSAPGAVVDSARVDHGFVQITPRGEGEATTQIGGFGIAVATGGRRESDATRRDRAKAAAIAETLDNRYDVLAYHDDDAKLSAAMSAWLLAEERAGRVLILLDGGTLLLIGSSVRVHDWSFSTLDDFCASIAPVVTDFAGRA